MGSPAIDNDKYWAEEAIRVCESFEYFLQNYCYIEDKITKEPVLFNLWPSQKRILPHILKDHLLIIIKARQLGLTWLCAAYCLWYCMSKSMKLVIVISAKGDWAVEFLDRVYFMLRLLPQELYTDVEKETTEVLRIRHHSKLTSTVKSLTTTEAGAQSKTPDILILDETCWNPYIRQIYSASKPGIDAAKGRIIAISNSIKEAPGWGWTRDLIVNSMKRINSFKCLFMPWQDHPHRPENFKEIQLTEEMDEDDFSQHYPETLEEAISAVAGSFFGKTLARHDAFIREHDTAGVKGFLRQDPKTKDIEFVEDPKGILEIWRWPYYLVDDWDGVYWMRMYAVGSDVSEGLGKSFSVGYVINRKIDELVARLRSNRIDAHEWGTQLDLLAKWYSSAHDHTGKRDDALICAERTGAGITTVKRLETLESNQYVREIPGKMGMSMTKEYGWSETQAAKYDLLGDLKSWFKLTKGGFYCPLLIDEASTTIRHENGRLEPEDDTKLFDCVIAAGCTIQASHFIGEGAKKIIPPVTGWRARIAREKETNWAT